MYSDLKSGIYPATSHDEYYSLSLGKSGNAFIEITHDSGYSAIYDKNLNFVADIETGPIFLEAGSYIVHADYSSPTYGVLSFYAPQLTAPRELTQLQSGTYPATTYDEYYSLSLGKSGNAFIEITHDSGYSAIYDKNLNFVADIETGPIFLEAGSYIVHADYSSPTYGVLSFYAPQLTAPRELTQLQSGTYPATTYDEYYSLSLGKSGNAFIEIAHDSGYSAIYDKNLNFVADIETGPFFLEAGSYIVHADYSSPTYGALTLYAPNLDTNTATPGDDSLSGTRGIDVIKALRGNDKVLGLNGRDELFGGGGQDLLKGGGGEDSLSGGSGRDRLHGGGGGDDVYGNGGNDKIYGNNGNDEIDGGNGSDKIQGGRGKDVLTGGRGADQFIFDDGETGAIKSKIDIITDFGKIDRIDLRAMDAVSSRSGDGTFIFNGETSAEHAVWYKQQGKHIMVLGDTDGDGQADFRIKLLNIDLLEASDFLL